MIEKIKIYAYAVLAILAIWFGYKFYSNYSAVTKRTAEAATNAAPAVPTPPPATTDTNLTATNPAAAVTNDATQTANQTAAATNSATPTNNAAVPTPPPVASTPAASTVSSPAPRKGSQGAMIAYLAAFVGTIIGLGLLIANDVSQFMGSRTVEFLFDDDGDGTRDPEYENAEKAWANGKPLEAIQMMRDYLKDHPREQYVALRIAEIYEKDLRNYLAAALEYEEVLKKKLEPERWGWAAIHLCNLYAKMGNQDKTRALLDRIVEEYPQTGAAKKAREKLGLPELQAATAPAVEAATEIAPEAGGAKPKQRMRIDLNEAAEPEEKVPEPPKSNLPPGFRPKK